MVDRQAFRLLQLHDLFMPQVNIALFKEGISLIKWVTNVYKMDYQLASYSPDRKNLNGGGGVSWGHTLSHLHRLCLQKDQKTIPLFLKF